MRNLLLTSIFLILTSCAALDVNRIAPGYAEAYKAIKLNVFGYNNEIDPDQFLERFAIGNNMTTMMSRHTP